MPGVKFPCNLFQSMSKELPLTFAKMMLVKVAESVFQNFIFGFSLTSFRKPETNIIEWDQFFYTPTLCFRDNRPFCFRISKFQKSPSLVMLSEKYKFSHDCKCPLIFCRCLLKAQSTLYLSSQEAMCLRNKLKTKISNSLRCLIQFMPWCFYNLPTQIALTSLS